MFSSASNETLCIVQTELLTKFIFEHNLPIPCWSFILNVCLCIPKLLKNATATKTVLPKTFAEALQSDSFDVI